MSTTARAILLASLLAPMTRSQKSRFLTLVDYYESTRGVGSIEGYRALAAKVAA